MAMPPEFAGVFDLPPVARLQRVEDLRNSLMPREPDLPIAEWVMQEAHAWKKRLDAKPASGPSWEVVLRRLDEA